MQLILQRTIKKICIIKQIFIEKNIDDKTILATLKKHSCFKKCGILKLEKFKDYFKIALKF
jgi:hypothetical protein